MGSVNETMKTVNTTLRTLLMTVLLGGAGYGGYIAYEMYNEPHKQLADKQAELESALENLESNKKKYAEAAAELDRTKVAMQLLKVRHRLAQLKCLDQKPNPESGKLIPPSNLSKSTTKGSRSARQSSSRLSATWSTSTT